MRHTKDKYQNSRCKLYLSGHYIKCEWIKQSIQKAEIGRKKNHSSSMLPVRDTLDSKTQIGGKYKSGNNILWK